MVFIPFERELPMSSNTITTMLELSTSAQPCSSFSCEQNGYYAAQEIFAFVSSLKLSRRLLCNIQPATRKSICRWNHQFEQIGCLCEGKSSGRPHETTTWDEFKSDLRVAHASQPLERVKNLEYRNQQSGVCWGLFTLQLSPSFWITL